MDKSIGSFIAALRKAKGMTQQEVADCLNVSNKTVSKWERNDGYPEITMIPAIAELFEVTADEILRGERIPRDAGSEKIAAKVEKQVRFLVNQAVTRFKNISYIAMALTFIGLNSMFTISYSLYRPLIGFGVMLALAAAGSIAQLIAVNGFLAVLRPNELLEAKGEHYTANMSLLHRYTFAAFALVALTIILSLPLVVHRDPYLVRSVLRFGEYLKLLPWLLLATSLVCLMGHAIARRFVPAVPAQSAEQHAKIRALNKKFVIILAALLVFTALGQLAADYVLSLPITQEFATREEMEEFSARAEQYQRSKEAASRNGWQILHEGEINLGQGKVFHIQDEFERIHRLDWDNLKVIYYQDYNTSVAREKAISRGFSVLYSLEVLVLGIVYLVKRKRIAK